MIIELFSIETRNIGSSDFDPSKIHQNSEPCHSLFGQDAHHMTTNEARDIIYKTYLTGKAHQLFL